MKLLIQNSILLLEKNIEVLNKLGDEQLLWGSKAYEGKDTIGKQFRHLFNFYEALLQGLNSSEINYEQRRRDKTIETKKEEAISYARSILELLKQKEEHILLDENINLIDPHYGKIRSSVKAELIRAHEHAVHHDAIISIILSEYTHQLNIPKEFGVAPSTLRAKINKG